MFSVGFCFRITFNKVHLATGIIHLLPAVRSVNELNSYRIVEWLGIGTGESKLLSSFAITAIGESGKRGGRRASNFSAWRHR